MLKNYFLLGFLELNTEGIPGNDLDAYAAGVPVIALKWESFSDVIEDGQTGIGYELKSLKELESILNESKLYLQLIIEKKHKCIEKAKEYFTTEVFSASLRTILSMLEHAK